MNNGDYRYPTACSLCKTIGDCSLLVRPYYKPGGKTKLMLIGQDPTIFQKPDRVKEVLMLDDPNSQLSRWLKGMIGSNKYNELSVYATNLVKCTFNKPPSTFQQGGLKYLQPYFDNCKEFLFNEIHQYKPSLVMTLGEPAHILFHSLFNNPEVIDKTMKQAFTGRFVEVKIGDTEFIYSPCLHIKTFRVAETYGQRVTNFKEGLNKLFEKW